MSSRSDTAEPSLQAPVATRTFDPFDPVPLGGGRTNFPQRVIGESQRLRRSEILAAIRRLVTESGCEGVTVRKIAETSGYVVQTVYNLVGPRDRAISEAITEYSIYVGRVASPALEDPTALPAILDVWIRASMRRPEFSRQCNLIFFTNSRAIYYRFRDRQLRGMQSLIRRQHQCGILRPEVNVAALAEQLVFFSSSMWVEWADRPFPLSVLQQKLYAGFHSLLADKLSPDFAAATLEKLSDPKPNPSDWRSDDVGALLNRSGR